jgi:DNA polymerase elongation subunit (family B)
LAHHVRNRIYTEIGPDEVHLLPTRQEFLDPALSRAIGEQVANGQPLLFLPNVTMDRDEWLPNAAPASAHACMDKGSAYNARTRKSSIFVFGVLPCGSRACVILRDLPIEFEVRVPPDAHPTRFSEQLRSELLQQKCSFKGHSISQHYPFIGFSRERVPYVKFTFDSFTDRNGIIEAVKKISARGPTLETASDDSGRSDYYFRKLAREFRFNTCDWNRLSGYEVLHGVTKCKYTFALNLDQFRRVGKAKKAEMHRALREIMDRDNTMVAVWDIETYRTIQNGQVPTPVDRDFEIFNICTSYFWQHSDTPLMSVCVMRCGRGYMKPPTRDAGGADAGVANEFISVAIACPDERSVVGAWIDVMGRMQPDIVGAYNGSNFDWPLVREICNRNGMCLRLNAAFSAIDNPRDTENGVYRWSWRREQMKINAENTHKLQLVGKFPGVLDIDIMPIFMKMYPAAEIIFSRGLNYFLAKNQLPSKEDMPYKRMFRIYERSKKFTGAGAPSACHCSAGPCTQPTGVSSRLYGNAVGAAERAVSACALCAEIVPAIDCIPGPAADNGEPIYTDQLLPSVAGKCCYCGKREQNRRDLYDVGFYCFIDCLRPQQLCVKRVIVMDKRELGTSSYTSLYDSVFRADGMRVRNLLGAYARIYDLAFSNSSSRKPDELKEHYPGAHVFPPERGLNNSRPVTGMDYASLYPNIIITNNRSPDMLVYDRETAERLSALGYTLKPIAAFEYERGPEKGLVTNTRHVASGWTVRHNGVISRRDRRIVERYDKVITVEHSATADTEAHAAGGTRVLHSDNLVVTFTDTAAADAKCDELYGAGVKYRRTFKYVPVYGREALPQERLGIFGIVVKKLFDKRVPIKAEFVRLSKLKERMELGGVKTIECPLTGAILDYERDVLFNLNKVDSKQRAIKVLSNTFYGESGNFQSRVYSLLVAAGVTTDGQASIKAVAKFVMELGYSVKYGDSVTADTPVPVRVLCTDTAAPAARMPTGLAGYTAQYEQICDLARLEAVASRASWAPYGDGKECVDLSGLAPAPLLVWTESGWTRVNHIIRHRTQAAIYRVHTGTAVVDVTECHSLLDSAGRKIAPADAVGVRLMHSDVFGCMQEDGGDAGAGANCDAGGDTGADVPPKLAAARRYHRARQLREIGVRVRGTGACAEYSVGPREPDSAMCTHVEPLGHTDDYVYDLETENRHFAAGIGNMIVHNTDSLYLTCPDRYYAHEDERYKREVAELERRRNAASDGGASAGESSTGADGKSFAGNTDSTVSAGDVSASDGVASADSAAIAERKFAARERYWHAMVEITMRVMTRLTESIADFLVDYTHGIFMKMAYEEVGFPTVFCGKKKYYMTPHIDTINFRPKDIFVKGIDIVKQGQTPLARELGEEFMRESLDVTNERTLIEIAFEKIEKFHCVQWPIEKFVLYAKYKPDKKNASVQTFVRRMRQEQSATTDPQRRALYEPPEPGDKFAYVVVAKQRYNAFGSQVKITKGDQMEYLRVYLWSQSTDTPMQLDMEYYFEKAILGIFSRFVAYHPDFQPREPYDPSDKEQYRSADQYMVKRASEFLKAYRNRLVGHDRDAVILENRVRRKIVERLDGKIRAGARREYGAAAEILEIYPTSALVEAARGPPAAPPSPLAADGAGGTAGPMTMHSFAHAVISSSECDPACADFARAAARRAVKRMIRHRNMSPFELNHTYCAAGGRGRARVDSYTRQIAAIEAKIREQSAVVFDMIQRYHRRFVSMAETVSSVDEVETAEDIVNGSKGVDRECVESFHAMCMRLRGIKIARAYTVSLMQEIASAKARAMDEEHVEEPKLNVATMKTLRVPEFVWT